MTGDVAPYERGVHHRCCLLCKTNANKNYSRLSGGGETFERCRTKFDLLATTHVTLGRRSRHRRPASRKPISCLRWPRTTSGRKRAARGSINFHQKDHARPTARMYTGTRAHRVASIGTRSVHTRLCEKLQVFSFIFQLRICTRIGREDFYGDLHKFIYLRSEGVSRNSLRTLFSMLNNVRIYDFFLQLLNNTSSHNIEYVNNWYRSRVT